MSDANKRLSVAEQIQRGLEDAILCARGELELRTTVVEVASRPMSPAEIIRLREGLGMDRRAFALTLDVTVSTVGSWERGDRRPSETSLTRLHKAKAAAETSGPGRRAASRTSRRASSMPRGRDRKTAGGPSQDIEKGNKTS